MLRNFWKTITMAGVVAMAAMPALAQLPLPPLPGLEIRVSNSAPPRMRRESRPPRPGRDYTWVSGSWDWQGSQWVWINGRWDRPERSGRWVAARYVRDGGYWRYEPAHWSYQRVIEGDDYRRWRDEHHRGHGYGHDRDHDRDRDHDNRSN